ncbi:hypothetical protein [Haloplanus vescus]|uniref:hypothetical protein n=1 Tax=Haloplanus vescus TaxID=555874 RepID=UPI001C40A4FA|nr:hypothetical protein [Haloplanus vescus]
MAPDSNPDSDSTFRVLPALSMIAGAVLAGMGLLVLQTSLFGGIHIAAIGVSLFLAGMISTRWAAARWNMSPAAQRNWSVAFVVLAGLLVVLFVIINVASFGEGTPIEEG